MRAVALGVVLTIFMVGLVASAQPQGCTETGTNGQDILAGGRRHDVLCARGARDYLAGLGGPDVLRGDGGRDTIVGGGGADRLLGMARRDNLFAVDGEGNDIIDGGPGKDRCFADPGDIVRNCEATFRGATIETATALSAAFGAQAVVAEELIAEPLPPPTVTVTITETVPPNCGGNPAPPPIC